MNELILATTAFSFVAFSVNAHAVGVEMYGQVNKGVMITDNGDSTSFNVVDNDFSSTRFGLRGSQVLANGLTASFLLEADLRGNSSSSVNGSHPSNVGIGNATFEERHARVGLAGEWGAVFVGKTSTATDGVTEVDLGAAQDVTGSAVGRIGGGVEILNAASAPTGFIIDNFANNMSGVGTPHLNSSTLPDAAAVVGDIYADRVNVVRYDSPIFEGFQGRVAVAQGGDIDLGVYYSGKFDAFEIAAGLGFVKFNDHLETVDAATLALVDAGRAAGDLKAEKQWSGSFSVKHDSGIAGTVAYGELSYDNKTPGTQDAEFYYGKLSYQLNEWGFAGEYGVFENALKDELKYYGLAAQYDMGHGVSVAGYWKNFDVDFNAAAATSKEVDVYGVGLRVKF